MKRRKGSQDSLIIGILTGFAIQVSCIHSKKSLRYDRTIPFLLRHHSKKHWNSFTLVHIILRLIKFSVSLLLLIMSNSLLSSYISLSQFFYFPPVCSVLSQHFNNSFFSWSITIPAITTPKKYNFPSSCRGLGNKCLFFWVFCPNRICGQDTPDLRKFPVPTE